MNVVLLGLGLQGRAALYDLVKYSTFPKIVAVDFMQQAVDWAKEKFGDERVKVLQCDVTKGASFSELLAQYDTGVVIDLLPIQCIPLVSSIAITKGWHFVNTYYTQAVQQELHQEAVKKELTILPEFGLDPGIDLVVTGNGISSVDTVTGFFSYGAGIPEPKACTNPLNYKISWIFEGVLTAYSQPATIIQDGEVITIPAHDIFSEKWLRQVTIDALGTLECHPNGDVTRYTRLARLNAVRNAGRYSMRYPGHARFWNIMAKLGLLEDKKVKINGHEYSQRKVLTHLFEPALQYAPHERDMTILRVELTGEKDGQNVQQIYELVDHRDLATGFMSMSRTVGFVASIGAQMIQSGVIRKRGLCNPLFDVPYEPFIEELEKREIHIKQTR